MPKAKTASSAGELVPSNIIEQKILMLRGHRIMLDSDLAQIYGVTTKRLNEQVKRNLDRFPEDFMFQLTLEEGQQLSSSRSQFATLKRGQNIKHAPYAFTEHGAVMLASVLNSPIAIESSIQVVRAFVRLRSILAAHKELAQKLEVLERKYDARFKVVFEAIRGLMDPPQEPKRQIGFDANRAKK